MLTVPEAARQVSKDPETIRRWIRAGKLRARKVGTQHVIDEGDLTDLVHDGEVPVPKAWMTFVSGRTQPDWVAAISRSRRDR